jgi:hypothetical protein
LLGSGAPRAEIDAFKLWLAFIDHGDTKDANQKFSCLDSKKNPDGSRICKPGQAVYYVSDMGSTFGYSSASEKKARLANWKGKDPIKVSGGKCSTTAKNVGDSSISEAGRALLARGLQRLLDAETSDGLITRVFRASRNDERDAPAEAWTAEFQRKAKTIIDARLLELKSLLSKILKGAVHEETAGPDSGDFRRRFDRQRAACLPCARGRRTEWDD